VLDAARWEVDFWLRLRDGDGGYSAGVTNPNDGNELFQAGAVALAAWANAANAAMMADSFRVAGLPSLAEYYRDQAVEAYTFASGLADQMLDEGQELDDGLLRGRDLKMMAAAFLYNVSGDASYEDVVFTESVCAAGPADLMNTSHHQLWATAGYLVTPRTVNYPTLWANMKTAIIEQAKADEADLIDSRPSRRATDRGPASFWRTAHAVDRSIIAHAISTDPLEIDHFRKALVLEADWGLGRNPMNIVEMTTATTPLATKRSFREAYTSGWYDGVDGVHPGHTPYLNLTDWSGMVMGRPSALYENSYPPNVPDVWPRGETYFPSRWVWAHTEFTPRQTMRGKAALYGYLYALADEPSPTHPTLVVGNTGVAGASGTVTSEPPGISCGSDCSESYPSGTDVTLTASSAAGSVFSGWSGACFGTDPTCELTMSQNRSVTATFHPEGLTHTLSVSTIGTGNGTVTSSPPGIDCGVDCNEPFLDGTPVELFATADNGSTFVGWSGSCSGSGACTLSMSADRSVTASFRSNSIPALIIYDDALANGWQDWSWSGTINLSGTTNVHEGLYAVDATLNAWGGFSPAMPSGALDTSFGYDAVSFWVHGGAGSDKPFVFFSEGDAGSSPSIPFTATAGGWSEIRIALTDLGNPGTISRVNFQNFSSNALETVSFDLIRIVPQGLFADGFESGDTSAWSSSP